MQYYLSRPAAVATMAGGPEASMLRGTVKFFQQPGSVLVVVDISGLPRQDGFYGFHIHDGDSCTGLDFADTKSHFNPTGKEHPFHAGDLPPLLGCNSKAFLAVKTDRFSIRDVIGRTVIIHSGPDDFTTQPAGNAGSKIACGVIRSV